MPRNEHKDEGDGHKGCSDQYRLKGGRIDLQSCKLQEWDREDRENPESKENAYDVGVSF